MRNGRKRTLIILGFWVIGIIAPFYSLSRLSPASRIVFDRVFQTQASHIIAHTFLFAVLAYLLISVSSQSLPSPKQTVILVIMTVALVAVLQEVVQMRSEGISLGFDEIFDFFVDLGGGMIGTWLYYGFNRDRRKSAAEAGDTFK